MSKLEIQDVIELDPIELQKWVRSRITDQYRNDKNFNWLGLAQALSVDTRDTNNVDKKILFAETAVEIYEWLANQGDPPHSDSNIDSAMLILIYMLSSNFVELSHPTLGEGKLSSLFWKGINLSPAEALIMAEELKDKYSQLSSSELDKLKKLRRIKNKLNLTKNLPSDSNLLAEIKLKGWLGICEMLP